MIFVFDAYGTLFDVDGAARQAAREDPTLALVWPALSADWRRKQLEYSWMRAITGNHADFWQVTADALEWAAEHHGATEQQSARLLGLYRSLPTYPDVADTLRKLRAQNARLAIFSNGSPVMLSDAVSYAGISAQFDALLSVESAGRFKPAPEAYSVVTSHFACTAADVTFVSSNGWDIYGAGEFGFTTAWINRLNLPVDRLPRRPDRILADLIGLI